MKEADKKAIITARLAHLDRQIYEAELNIKIYAEMIKKYDDSEDRKILNAEHQKLDRFRIARKVVEQEQEG